MSTKEVLLLLTDRWADWEAAHAIAGINLVPQYTVKTIGADKVPKTSIGGLRAEVDYTIDSYTGNAAMLILTGGFGWQESRHDEIAAFIKKAIGHKIPIAAICGATIFLGKHGLLDGVKHTGDELELFQEHQGYAGESLYVRAQVAVDKGFITANETASVDFARAIFEELKAYADEEIDAWHSNFKRGMVCDEGEE